MPEFLTQRSKIGRYELIQRLAVGGMAEVFIARETGPAGLERRVVVKRILPHLSADEEFVQLFLEEARVLARLQHPGIVQVYELGEEEGSWFIAMEHVPGVTVRQLYLAAQQAKQRIPIAVAVGIVMQACESAHAAHELSEGGRPLGLVHRDITPQNIMVTDDGRVKLLDFGIAKKTADTEATREGGVKGKASYLSPEQCRQAPLDRRSDVFALGILLWELITGRSLFKRTSEYETLRAVDEAVWHDLRPYCPELPDDIVRVIRKALSRERDDRFSTADEMRMALAKAAQDERLDAGIDAVRQFAAQMLGERRKDEREALDRAFAGIEPLSPDMRARLSGLGEDDSVTGLKRKRMRRRQRWMRAAGSVAAALLLVGGGWWGVNRPPPVSGEPLTIGLAPTIDVKVIADEFDPLRVYLERRTGRPFRLKIAPSYEELGRMLGAGETSFALMPGYLLIKVRGESPAVEPLVTDLIDGSPGNNGVILVNEYSNVGSLADLRGQRLCLIDSASTTGYALPRAALRQSGIDPDRDVVPVMSGNHQQALRDLFQGRCDAAATYDKAYLVADRAGVPTARMRVLGLTGRAPNDTFCASPNTTPVERSMVREALLDFQPSRDVGSVVLGDVLRISAFVPVDEKGLDRLDAVLSDRRVP